MRIEVFVVQHEEGKVLAVRNCVEEKRQLTCPLYQVTLQEVLGFILSQSQMTLQKLVTKGKVKLRSRMVGLEEWIVKPTQGLQLSNQPDISYVLLASIKNQVLKV